MAAISGVGALFALPYFLIVAAVAVLSVWALVLLIIFLRLRIAEMRSAASGQGAPGTGRLG
ncbi:hypothetical protein [Arthrobacter sp. 08Y14]|uniref:hypothetical protein n=1 Tax=Arthrobacter sp. 08Y14 TaxID=2058885 RepID=UPI000CE51E72|nr:hypothetical protein [Arthrobacter sp. 08Y14]